MFSKGGVLYIYAIHILLIMFYTYSVKALLMIIFFFKMQDG